MYKNGVKIIEEPVVVVDKKQSGVLFFKRSFDPDNRKWRWGWFKGGNEKTDEKYVGEIGNNQPNGKGTIIYPGGGKYIGEFKDGKYNGQGTYMDERRKYKGGWKNGKKHGHGTLIYDTTKGKKYVGEFSKRSGEFKEDKPWDITEYDRNGNIIGKWVNGVKQ